MESVYHSHSQRTQRFLDTVHTRTRLKLPELLVLLSYPFTIILGQILFHTSPELVVNYYTNKHNILNVLFVKKGWFWTLLLTSYFLIQHHGVGVRTISRLALGTLWWVLFTQWFFGLPLMDRVFQLTGGVCKYDTMKYQSVVGEIGSVMCRKLKGRWDGGHDPSGHVFLLVHSSLIMWFEMVEFGVFQDLKEFIQKIQRLRQQRMNVGTFVWRAFIIMVSSSTVLLVSLLSLWWWMLLVTSTHFHSFSEKLTGLAAGYLGLLIYIIPRFL